MVIRIRKVEGRTIAICAALSEKRPGDIYLDDEAHHALSSKFGLDWFDEGFLGESLADEALVPIMRREQGGFLTHEEKERSK